MVIMLVNSNTVMCFADGTEMRKVCLSDVSTSLFDGFLYVGVFHLNTFQANSILCY